MHGEQPSNKFDPKQGAQLLRGMCMAAAAPLEALLRKPGTPGERHFDKHAMIGLPGMFLIIVFAGGTYDGICAIGAFLVVCLALLQHRVRRWQLAQRGIVWHSRYTGLPLIPGPELLVKQVIEPALAFGAGLVCTAFGLGGLGRFLMLAAVGSALRVAMDQMEWQSRLRAMRDAEYDQKFLAEEMRGGRR